MIDPQNLEKAFEGYISNLPNYIPDGLFTVDFELLQELNLVNNDEQEKNNIANDFLNESFYVIESEDKLTLFNQKYSIWIFPQVVGNAPMTFTLIARNENENPHLEMGFTTAGIYNHSSLVLKVLERFLEEIDENEKEINSWSKN